VKSWPHEIELVEARSSDPSPSIGKQHDTLTTAKFATIETVRQVPAVDQTSWSLPDSTFDTKRRRTIMTDEISLLRKMSSNDRENLVLTAMERLIPRYDARRMLALIWRLWEEKPIEEVADKLGVTPGTITKWCASATEQLRPILSDLLNGRKLD
jgi:DNA-directed RNA polymerase specialized sigma24 family protein